MKETLNELLGAGAEKLPHAARYERSEARQGCRRREFSVEEAPIEMYLAGVSARRVEDITEAFWGSKVSIPTIRELAVKSSGAATTVIHTIW